MVTLLIIIFGAASGCFLSVLVGLLGRQRSIGFGWSFLLSLILTPIVGLIITLLSPLRPVAQRTSGCLGGLFAILGFICLLIFVLLLFGIISIL